MTDAIKLIIEELAEARLKELTRYMSDSERKKLIREGRSETVETFRRGARALWDILARQSKSIFSNDIGTKAQEYQAKADENVQKLAGRNASPVEAMISEDAFYDGAVWKSDTVQVLMQALDSENVRLTTLFEEVRHELDVAFRGLEAVGIGNAALNEAILKLKGEK